MKKKLLVFSIFVLSICVVSTKSYAQRDAGGSAGGTTPPPVVTTFTVPVGSSIVLTFTQPDGTAYPVLTSVLHNGTVTAINGCLSQLSCLNFSQFFQVLGTCATYYHPSGCSHSTCLNPRCH